MKKILALILALVMIASLAACAKDTNTPNTDTNTNTGNVDTNTGNTDENTGSENDANTENNEPETPTEDETPSEPETPAEPEDNTNADEENTNEGGHKLDANTVELSVVLQGLYEGYNEELPMLGEMPLEDPETFQWITFVEYVEGAEGMVSEPMMGSIAHSFVLVRVPEGTDAAEFAAQMEANCDPRKWICVEAEKVASASYGNLALLCMSNEVLVDIAIENFNSMFN